MTRGIDTAAPLRLCILGGSLHHRGGLEAYCQRAEAAISDNAKHIAAVWVATDSAYLGVRQFRHWLARIAFVWRNRHAWDLVWLQISNLPDLAYLAVLSFAGKPVLATPHFGANSRLQTQAGRRIVCRSFMALADRIGLLFAEQAVEIDLPQGIPREIVGTFLPRSSFADRERSQGDRDVLYLLHAARFSPGKGSFAMIELCAVLKAQAVDFTARLVGRADEQTMSALVRLIAEKGLQRHIEITPWLGEEDMQAALRAADVLVHLSTLDSFPLIVLEALAADTLPLVRSMRGGDAMVSSYGGHVVAGPAPVEEAAAWLMRTPLDEIRASGRAAGERARKACCWSSVVHNLDGVFSRVLNSPCCPSG